MKKLILILICVAFKLGLNAQTGYIHYNSKTGQIGFYVDSNFYGPAGVAPSFRGGPVKTGAIFIDTINHRFYFYDGAWRYSPTTALSRFAYPGEDDNAAGHRSISFHDLYNLTFDSVNQFLVTRNGVNRIVSNSLSTGIYSAIGSNAVIADADGPTMVNGSGTIDNFFRVKKDSSIFNKKVGYTSNVAGTYTDFSFITKHDLDSAVAGAGGSVDTIFTDDASGIIGGPITNTGLLSLDTTNIISTKWYRDKLADSIGTVLDDYVPEARTITINGVSQNLSTNRTWTVTGTSTLQQVFDTEVAGSLLPKTDSIILSNDKGIHIGTHSYGFLEVRDDSAYHTTVNDSSRFVRISPATVEINGTTQSYPDIPFKWFGTKKYSLGYDPTSSHAYIDMQPGVSFGIEISPSSSSAWFNSDGKIWLGLNGSNPRVIVTQAGSALDNLIDKFQVYGNAWFRDSIKAKKYGWIGDTAAISFYQNGTEHMRIQAGQLLYSVSGTMPTYDSNPEVSAVFDKGIKIEGLVENIISVTENYPSAIVRAFNVYSTNATYGAGWLLRNDAAQVFQAFIGGTSSGNWPAEVLIHTDATNGILISPTGTNKTIGFSNNALNSGTWAKFYPDSLQYHNVPRAANMIGKTVLVYDTTASGNFYQISKDSIGTTGGGGAISDGDYGDITVSSTGTVWTIDNLTITNAKINDVAWAKITSVPDAVADGSTKGVASFAASDFNSSSGNITLDITNAQSSDGSHKGFLTSTDWNTFNNKQPTGLSWLLAGNTVGAYGKYIGTNDDYDLVFKANGVERMRIDSATGSVGIGTSSPQATFHIANPATNSYTQLIEVGGSTQAISIFNTGGNVFSALNIGVGSVISSNIGLTLGALSGNVGISSNTGTVDISAATGTSITGALSLSYVAKTANYTATASDYTIDCTSGTFTVTLPTAVGCTGRIYVIKNSGAGTITIATTSSQTIDGITTQTLSTPNSSYMVQSTNGTWIIIN
jgi:hypothetical protein